MPLTEQEIKVFEQTGRLYSDLRSLPEQHPHDIPELIFHIHAIQNILLSRSAMRELQPDKYK